MPGKSDPLDSNLSLRFSREQGFFDKNQGIRGLLYLTFMISLFLFIHFREVRVEVLELNTVAERYIVAQVDFSFLDADAAELYKQEAVRDIGKIYRLVEKDIRQGRSEFESYLQRNKDWRKNAKSSTFEELYQAVDILEDHLARLRFTDPRTLNKMRDATFPTTDYEIFIPSEDLAPTDLPSETWGHIQIDAFSGNVIRQETVDFLLNHFRPKMWTLEEDIKGRAAITSVIRGRIPTRLTKVSAGDRIIDQGDKVTMRHLEMLQAMKNTLSEKRNLWHPGTLFGSLLMTGILLGVSYAYFSVNHPDVLRSNRRLFLLFLIMLLTLILSKAIEYTLLKTTINLLDFVRYPLFVPLAAILVSSLFSPGIAIYTSGALSVILGMTLAVERQGFLLVNLITAIVVILAVRSLRHRREVFKICAKGGAACLTVLFSLHFYESTWWSVTFVADMLSTIFFMTVTAVLAVGLLPLFESSFHILTDIALMEYMDPNHDVLRRLSMEAPGTYQHSLVVGNLAEAAAVAIGANGLFCRASTLYHDIGKLITPHYFTENQQGEMNIHQLLTPLESTQVIMAHVAEGVAIARKIGLPEQFIDVIKQHHGTTRVYYFYRQQLEHMGGDSSLVEESDFRYAGPKPHSKESAIIMIADTMEAASRSLEDVNEEILTELIDRLVRDKAEDGQFDECELTFEELGVVKRTMVTSLLAARHSRIKYPQQETKEEVQTSSIEEVDDMEDDDTSI